MYTSNRKPCNQTVSGYEIDTILYDTTPSDSLQDNSEVFALVADTPYVVPLIGTLLKVVQD